MMRLGLGRVTTTASTAIRHGKQWYQCVSLRAARPTTGLRPQANRASNRHVQRVVCTAAPVQGKRLAPPLGV
eukprot:scaffold3697_cov390-Prasinococcus_capsulatus_cf.AAC.3